MPEMPVPILVVEVVSSSNTDQKSRDRDYKEKRAEYAAQQIPEYWIVDPIAAVVLVLTLDGEQYRESVFTGTQMIVSPTFSNFNLMTEQGLCCTNDLRTILPPLSYSLAFHFVAVRLTQLNHAI
jgi:Uma2 family endonuclease